MLTVHHIVCYQLSKSKDFESSYLKAIVKL